MEKICAYAHRFFVIAFLLCFLCSCGQDAGNASINTSKGTRNDPYVLGEEISFESCSITEPDYKFTTTMTIEAVPDSKLSSVVDAYNKTYLTTANTAFYVNLKISSPDGSYSDTVSNQTNSDGGFLLHAYTSDMTESYANFTNSSSPECIYDFYTDVDYALNAIIIDDLEYQYLSITYSTGEYDENTIWITLK